MSQERNISITYSEFDSQDELNAEDQELITAARTAAKNAYAPYSRFMVGAAVKLDTGEIVSGCNVENAAFPSGICAERNVLSGSVSGFPGSRPVVMAVVAYNANGPTAEPVSPCGNCRQVIAEEEFRNSSPIRIIMVGEEKIRVVESVGALLPLQFTRESFL